MNILLLQALLIVGGGAVIAAVGLFTMGYVFRAILYLLGK